MVNRTLRSAASVVALACAWVSPSQALTVGNTLGCSATPAGFFDCSVPSFVVGAGAELSLDLFNQAFFSVDFSATSITFAYLDPLNVGTMGLGAGETVTFTGFDEAIVGVGLTTAGVTDLDASDLSFTSNTLSINLDSGAFYSPGATFVVTVQGKAVPLPATMPLVGLALAGLALNRRRKP